MTSVEGTPSPGVPNIGALLFFVVILVTTLVAKLSIHLFKRTSLRHHFIKVFDTYFLLIVVSLILVNVYFAAPILQLPLILHGILPMIYHSIPGKIESVYPPENQSNVPLYLKSVGVKFSIPIDNSSIKNDSLTLLNVNSGEIVNGMIGANPRFLPTIIDLIPSNQLEPNTTYKASVDTHLKYISGMSVANDKIWFFTTSTQRELD